MKVLQVLPTLSAGGAESFIANLSVSLSRQGVDCRIFLTGGVRGQRGRMLHAMLEENGVEVIGGGERPVRSLANMVALFRLFRSFRPQIVQANLRSSEMIAVAVLGFLGRDRWRLLRRLAVTRMKNSPGGQVMQRWFAKRFDAAIACSPAVSRAYENMWPDRRPSERVFTISNGCVAPERTYTKTEVEQAKSSLGIPCNSFVVAHVGRMDHGRSGTLTDGQKAHDIVIRSFAAAFGSVEDVVQLVLVGDGPARRDVEALATALGIGDKVRFLGLQPDPWTALKAADVFLFPSRYEGIPNALLEAACFGVPVVASDIDEVQVLLPKNGWKLCRKDDVVAFAAALHAVREDIPELRKIAVQNAEIFQDGYSMKACAAQYLRVYRACLGKG